MNHIYCGHTLAWRRRPSLPGPGAAEQRGRVPPPPPGGHGDAGGCAGNRDSNATLLPAVREQGGPCLRFQPGRREGHTWWRGKGKGPRGCRRKSRGCGTNVPFLLSSPQDSSPPRQASLKDAALHAALAQSWAPGGRSPAPSNAALLLEPKSCAPMARFANAPAHTCVPVRAHASTREHTRAHASTRHARPTLHL